ncbi:MAG: hypothetical protein K8R46_00685 [Pirellulales bacterium]|nr:hypothetical protein [Pirellulales bacterium]
MNKSIERRRLPLFLRRATVSDHREAYVAWGVWALLTAAGLWFVAVYGFTMPYGDEWVWLPVTAGQQPASLSWLWSTHNEHRMVVPRLIYLGLGLSSGFDFRAGAFYNIIALSGLSLAMMVGARAVRGRTSVYDAFFPLLLLHWAQCENIVWGFQLNFITSAVLAGVVLLAIVRCGERLSLALALLITVCLVGLGLCGLYGLVYLPALACWLAYAGISRCRDPAPRAWRDGLSLIALAGLPLALVAACSVGFRAHPQVAWDVWGLLVIPWQFLSCGFGPGAKEIWPVSGLLVAAACGYALWQFQDVYRRQPRQRVRAAGLFCFLGGIVTLALAIGVGRAFEDPQAGFMHRYMTLAAPLLCLFYLQFTLYGSPAVRIHLQRAMAVLMCGLLLVNMPKGLRYAEDFRRLMTRLEADIRSGIPPADLAIRHGEALGFATEEVFALRLEMLRQARLGPYGDGAERPDHSLRVHRIGESLLPRSDTKRLCLRHGDSFTQYLQIPADSILYRIDVRISCCRGRRTLERLDWKLYGVVFDHPRRLLAHDTIDVRRLGRDHYVSLAIPPTSVHAAERLALVLTPAAECPRDSGVDLPLYSCSGAKGKTTEADLPPSSAGAVLRLNGFMFLKHTNPDLQTPHKRPSGLSSPAR